MKNKKRIIWGIIAVVTVMVVGLSLYGIFGKEKPFEPEQGPYTQSELQLMNKRIRKVMHQDENNRSYYGGCYLDNGNLIIMVTKEFKNAMPEVKEAIEKEEGVILRKVKYTLVELEELQDEIWDMRMELEETGSESTKKFLEDFNTGGVYEMENRVGVGIKDLTLWKQMKFRTLFHLWGDGRILFESNSGVWLD